MANVIGFCAITTVIVLVLNFLVLPAIKLNTRPLESFCKRFEKISNEASLPNLILFGGSNLGYGIDMPMLEQAFNGRYRITNLGMHAGMGAGLIFDLLDNAVKSGDVVILACEYPSWGWNWDGELVATVIRCDVQNHTLLGSTLDSRWSSFDSRAARSYILEKLGKLLENSPHADDVPTSNSMPDDGSQKKEIRTSPTLEYANAAISFGKKFYLDAISKKRLNQLRREYAEKHVKLLLSCPTYDARLYALHEKDLTELWTGLRTVFKEDCISDPRDYVYPLSEMDNSCWHVNAIGRSKRTQRLIAQIEKRLAGK